MKTSSHYEQLAQASEWFAVLSDESVSDDERAAWQDWLNEKDENRKAWQEVESISGMFTSLGASEHVSSASHLLSSSQSRTIGRRQFMKGVMGLAGLAVIGLGSWQTMPFLPRSLTSLTADLSTHTGQVKSYELDDGSTVWLNTNSAMDDNIANTSRHLSLLQGEAQVETVPQSAYRQPLSLSCGCGLLKTQQARFNIRSLSTEQAVLAVFEGEVAVSPLHSKETHIIKAGEQVRFSHNQVGKAQPAQALYDSWKEGLLVVENMRLSDFVRELGRYQVGYINLDPRIADLHIIGTFPTEKTDLVLDMLTKSLPIRVTSLLPFWVNISAA